jgi:hypothetical protein
MITGMTEEGFKFKISEHIADDYRVLNLLNESMHTTDDMVALSSGLELPKLVFGEKQLNKYMDFLTKKDGYPSMQKVLKATMNVFQSAEKESDQVKNS